MSEGLEWLGVADSSLLIQARAVTPLEILDAVLEWIDRTNQVTRPWVELLADQARLAAESATREQAGHAELHPLHGILYSVKDVIAVRDVPLRANSKLTEGFVPREDADVVARLRAAGAICLGKVATAEFSLGRSSPPARNPWDGASTPGASSGGSGSAVASGYGPASVGADCGASIRMPAALNGVTGLRPTHGRISTRGAIPLSMTLDTVGPIARSAEDVALLLNAMAGAGPSAFGDRLDASVGGLRVGVPTSHFFDRLEDGVRSRVEAAIARLGDIGMEVREVDLPRARHAKTVFRVLAAAEGAALLDDCASARLDDLSGPLRGFVELGNRLLAKDYCRAQQMRALVREDFERALADVDVIVAPVTAATAKPLPEDPAQPVTVTYPDGEVEDLMWAYTRLTFPISLSGCPTLAIPCGLADDGMPVGLQIVGRHLAEDVVLQVGYALQQATSWHLLRPTALMAAAGDIDRVTT